MVSDNGPQIGVRLAPRFHSPTIWHCPSLRPSGTTTTDQAGIGEPARATSKPAGPPGTLIADLAVRLGEGRLQMLTARGEFVSELTPFDDFLATLPSGNLRGSGSEEFRIASEPDVFVPPTLQRIDRSVSPSVTMLSARGATGKSHLAREVSATKQVPLWSLDRDLSVSAHALESKLSRYLGPPEGLHRFELESGAFIVIDALDEARMRVSAMSWAEFIDSLAAVARYGHRFVLLGRERILEDVWVQLVEADIRLDWLELSHFDTRQRVEYVDRNVQRRRSIGMDAGTPYALARDAVLSALAGTVDTQHADSFVGYAPVLDAVVSRAIVNSCGLNF
jgi:hypothetical protein